MAASESLNHIIYWFSCHDKQYELEDRQDAEKIGLPVADTEDCRNSRLIQICGHFDSIEHLSEEFPEVQRTNGCTTQAAVVG